jgi:hypothetical protein
VSKVAPGAFAPLPEPTDIPGLAANPAEWPQPWADLFRRSPPAPRLVITYWELGFDLSGQADPRRSALWRRLIHDLGLAGQNAVTFWPIALPEHGDLQAAPAWFAAGLARFAPRVLAVFGDVAASRLPALQDDPSGTRRILLPEPSALFAADTEAWNHVLATLGRP